MSLSIDRAKSTRDSAIKTHRGLRERPRTCKPDPIVPAAYLHRKRWIDCSLAVVLLVAGTPVILLTMAIMRMTSKGPAIFRQTRVGLNGQVFVMYKLRTMRVDAEQATGPVWATKKDPRITTVGRILRTLHLDEFPQLINVIRGDMSLVGPRPERPEFTEVLDLKIPEYMHRHTVRPGITGLAQINLPPDTDLDSVRRKLVLDFEYIERANTGMDVRIFLATFLRLGGIRHGMAVRLLNLRRVPVIASATATAECASGLQKHAK